MEENKETEIKNYARQQLIVFKLGNEEYALKIDQIKEIVLTPIVTKVPQTPSYVKGLANIRGNIIAILDLEEKFKVEGIQEKTGKYTLVVESETFKIGLMVNQVPNTLTVTENNIELAQDIVGDVSSQSNYIQGIVKIDNRLIILIDVYQLMKEKELQAIN
jgi:purine-binding chemotaxis protein CheW